MKRATFLCIAMMMFSTALLQSEARTLPAGTVISIPGTPTAVLDAGAFLLDRDSMERATLALETVAIREEQIAKLTASYETLKTWAIVGTVALPVVAILLDEVVHALVGR
jgi:hypothetical protein